MEKPPFTRANLSDVRAIMAIMRVPVMGLLCQAVMGWILILKYLLVGVCGCMRPCPTVPSIKCRRFLRPQLLWCSPSTEGS
jgi:hypothetical protein